MATETQGRSEELRGSFDSAAGDLGLELSFDDATPTERLTVLWTNAQLLKGIPASINEIPSVRRDIRDKYRQMGNPYQQAVAESARAALQEGELTPGRVMAGIFDEYPEVFIIYNNETMMQAVDWEQAHRAREQKRRHTLQYVSSVPQQIVEQDISALLEHGVTADEVRDALVYSGMFRWETGVTGYKTPKAEKKTATRQKRRDARAIVRAAGKPKGKTVKFRPISAALFFSDLGMAKESAAIVQQTVDTFISQTVSTETAQNAYGGELEL